MPHLFCSQYEMTGFFCRKQFGDIMLAESYKWKNNTDSCVCNALSLCSTDGVQELPEDDDSGESWHSASRSSTPFQRHHPTGRSGRHV